MLIIKHRINTLQKLKKLEINFGAEIDIRSNNNELIISHEPFYRGEKLITWLSLFRHKFIIFNIKEEGIEFELKKLIEKFKIKRYFLLDQSFPFYISNLRIFGRKSSIRISEYEGIEKAVKLRQFTRWLWLDHFSDFPLTSTNIKKLKLLNFKFCVVSPELVNLSNISKKINLIKNRFEEADVNIDAVCTKTPDYWTQK